MTTNADLKTASQGTSDRSNQSSSSLCYVEDARFCLLDQAPRGAQARLVETEDAMVLPTHQNYVSEDRAQQRWYSTETKERCVLFRSPKTASKRASLVQPETIMLIVPCAPGRRVRCRSPGGPGMATRLKPRQSNGDPGTHLGQERLSPSHAFPNRRWAGSQTQRRSRWHTITLELPSLRRQRS